MCPLLVLIPSFHLQCKYNCNTIKTQDNQTKIQIQIKYKYKADLFLMCPLIPLNLHCLFRLTCTQICTLKALRVCYISYICKLFREWNQTFGGWRQIICCGALQHSKAQPWHSAGSPHYHLLYFYSMYICICILLYLYFSLYSYLYFLRDLQGNIWS